MPRGNKTCPTCNTGCGPRSYRCACGYEFPIKSGSTGEKPATKPKIVRKRKPKAVRVVNWQDLKIGTKFKVASGSGPYYTANGERIYMSERGYFYLQAIKQDGLVATDDRGTWSFIYMGRSETSPNIPGLTREAHRIWVRVERQ